MKLKGDSKGLSPIFASLTILAIVTVLFIPVFLWTTGLTADAKNFWDLTSLVATERIVIEEVNLQGSVSDCTIYVRNIGKPAITIDNVYISSTSASLYTFQKDQFTTDVESVVQGDLITITVANLGFTPTSDVVYTVQVYTMRGVGATCQVIA